MVNISIVVPFYNSEKTVEKCIQSLLEQKYPKHLYEIILVNNNSTDGSTKLIENYPVNLYHESKQGSYAARNCGIKKSQGKIVAFIDSDCMASNNWLQSIEQSMQNPQHKIVMGTRNFISKSFFLNLLSNYENTKAQCVFNSNNPDIFFGYTNNMAVEKKFIEQSGYFKEILRGADTIFVNQAAQQHSCQIVCFNPSMCITHLEIKNIFTYFFKKSIYGFSSNNHQKNILKTLDFRDRMAIFIKLSKSYSWYKKLILLCLLFVGVLFWYYGRWKALIIKR